MMRGACFRLFKLLETSKAVKPRSQRRIGKRWRVTYSNRSPQAISVSRPHKLPSALKSQPQEKKRRWVERDMLESQPFLFLISRSNIQKATSMTIPRPMKTTITNGPTESRIALVTNPAREIHGIASGRYQFPCPISLPQVRVKRNHLSTVRRDRRYIILSIYHQICILSYLTLNASTNLETISQDFDLSFESIAQIALCIYC